MNLSKSLQGFVNMEPLSFSWSPLSTDKQVRKSFVLLSCNIITFPCGVEDHNITGCYSLANRFYWVKLLCLIANQFWIPSCPLPVLLGYDLYLPGYLTHGWGGKNGSISFPEVFAWKWTQWTYSEFELGILIPLVQHVPQYLLILINYW